MMTASSGLGRLGDTHSPVRDEGRLPCGRAEEQGLGLSSSGPAFHAEL